MKISQDIKLDFDDVLLVPHRSQHASRKSVVIDREFKFFHSPRTWCGVPLMVSNMDTTGTIKMSLETRKHKIITCLHKYHNNVEVLKRHIDDYAWISIGMDEKSNSLVATLARESLQPNICIDVANGYMERFVEYCYTIRELFPESIIMAGNVCTPEMVQELILHGGVDIVKTGISGGSACSTRLQTGIGCPQLSCVIECAHAAHGLKSGEKRLGLICSDGGCRTPGDVCKAFAANADFVMMGGMFAGVDECNAEWEFDNCGNKIYMKFYGMSSICAQKKHKKGMPSYATSEGRVKYVEYKGRASDVIQNILGGIRSCCAYIGASSIKDMSKCAEFIRVNRIHYDTTTEKIIR